MSQRIVARGQGREGWTREGRRQLEQRRWQRGQPVPPFARGTTFARSRAGLEEQRDMKLAANRAYEDYRTNGRAHGRPQARPSARTRGPHQTSPTI